MSEIAEHPVTECPKCSTRFRVTVEQLDAAGGRVRCGACLTVFQGREAIIPPDGPAPAKEREPDPKSEALDILLGTADDYEGEPPTGAHSDEEATPAMATEADEEPAVDEAAGSGTSLGVLALAVVGAWLLCAAGVLLLQFDAWSQQPFMRDVYGAVGIDLPPFKDLGTILVSGRSVPERPGTPAPLVVSMDLTNTAPLRQRFPVLTVRFANDAGERVAEQGVEPKDYLPSPSHSRLMAPGTPTRVRLSLGDPGPDAVSYSISLR